MSFGKWKAVRAIGCAVAGIVVITGLIRLVKPVQAEGERSSAEVSLRDYSTDSWEPRSGRHTQYRDADASVVSPYTVGGYTRRIESNELEIWARDGSSNLRIVDRRSGYVWGLSGDEKPEGLNKSWYSMASALCSVEYYTASGSDGSASTESEGAKISFDWRTDGFTCHTDLTKQGIRFDIEGVLDGPTLRLSVAEGSLEEYGDCKLSSLYFMPFLGSTYSDSTDGYFFVPDGSGALIRFQKPSDYSSALEGRVYGPDPGIDSLTTAGNLLASRGNDYLVAESGMTLPVFGIVHGEGQNGILAVIESGVEQAYIKASPAGLITDYNWLTARFAYRASYMKPVNKAGSGVYTAQEEANDIHPGVSYTFLTGEEAGYSSMAVLYRERLREEGVLSGDTAGGEIPMWLSILGTEIKKGVLYNSTTVLTTLEEGRAITDSLREEGIGGLRVCLYGWQRGGVNGSSYSQTRLDGRLGGEDELEAWKRSLAETGGELLLYRNLGQANEDQITERTDAVMNISSAYAAYRSGSETAMYPDSYVVRLETAAGLLRELRDRWPDYGLALDNIGHDPSSDYTRGDELTRRQTMDAWGELLKTECAGKAVLFRPSVYLWPYAGTYLDIPMNSSQYLFETDSVPFLQMVLKGSVEYFTPYANLDMYSDSAVLKMVEYGAYPAFIVAAAESYELENTPLETLFTVNFSDWNSRIREIYGVVSDALGKVSGKTILSHRMAASGVACVTYEGGIRIYVNYNGEPVTVDGVTVPAMDYLVEGGEQ